MLSGKASAIKPKTQNQAPMTPRSAAATHIQAHARGKQERMRSPLKVMQDIRSTAYQAVYKTVYKSALTSVERVVYWNFGFIMRKCARNTRAGTRNACRAP